MDKEESILLPDPSTTTILLIDANDKDRTYYADRLKFLIPDCVVLEAKDGRTGLELHKSRRVDCIVTELYLPDMSAFELLLTVVPRASAPTVPVVILTRNAIPTLSDLAKINGAQAVLVKRLAAGDELVPIVLKAMATVGPTRKEDGPSSTTRANDPPPLAPSFVWRFKGSP
jgi:DNA-binding NarL/FixJ family response regulator